MTSSDIGTARRAVSLVFLVNGSAMGLWAGHIPAVRTGLGLGEAALGAALLAMALGAILMMPATGWLAGRFGSRAVTRVAGIAFTLLLALPLLAPSWEALLAATLLMGAANGAMDVAMNTQAAAVQRHAGRPIMSAFHAFFSLGGVAGAGMAALLLAVLPEAAPGMAGAALALAAVMLVAGPRLLDEHERHGGGGFMLPTRAALAVGLLAFLAILAEGAVLDWSAVYMADRLGAPAAVAALAFATFSATMTIGRLTGDAVVRRIGAPAVLAGSGLLAAAGLGLAVLVAQPGMAVLGFALAGLGLANSVPVLFSAAAGLPGLPAAVGVAMVASLGYAGGLSGPALIGFAAEAWGLRAALAGLVAAGLVIALAALLRPGLADASAAKRRKAAGA